MNAVNSWGFYRACAALAAMLVLAAGCCAMGGKCGASACGTDACGKRCGPAGGKAACAASAQAADGAKTASAVGTISTAGLQALLKAGTPVAVLDARSGKWDDGKRIPGAKSLNAESAKQEVEALLTSKDALIVTYCGSVKCPASHKLAEHLKALGYKNVVEYPEGIAGWTAAGNEVVPAK